MHYFGVQIHHQLNIEIFSHLQTRDISLLNSFEELNNKLSILSIVFDIDCFEEIIVIVLVLGVSDRDKTFVFLDEEGMRGEVK